MTGLRKCEDFASREIGDEIILVPIARARADLSAVLVLEGIGRGIWELLDEYHSEEDVLEAILSRYDVAPAVAAAELRSFLDELKEIGALLESEPDDTSPESD